MPVSTNVQHATQRQVSLAKSHSLLLLYTHAHEMWYAKDRNHHVAFVVRSCSFRLKDIICNRIPSANPECKGTSTDGKVVTPMCHEILLLCWFIDIYKYSSIRNWTASQELVFSDVLRFPSSWVKQLFFI